MKICKKNLSFLTCLVLVPFSSFAETRCCDEKNFLRPVIALTAGAAITSDSGESQEFPIGFSKYDYNTDNDTETRGVFGGFIGTELALQPLWDLQVGIAYYQTTPFSVEGKLKQGIDPSTSHPFDYHYEIVSRQLLVESKLLTHWGERYHPYISLGLGAAFNKAKDYDIDYPANLVFTPFFNNHTETSFSYNIGLGIDYDMTKHLRLGMGYRFTDLGKAELSQGYIDPINAIPISETLQQSHLYTQEILVQLTYVM